MASAAEFLQTLRASGAGARARAGDARAPPRLGVYDLDRDLEEEPRGRGAARPSCGACGAAPAGPRLLQLHLQERHDSYFAALAAARAAYSCYVEECAEKFWNPDERMAHCVRVHELPKDFRFDCRPKKRGKEGDGRSDMEVDEPPRGGRGFRFNNGKRKVFQGYAGKKFTEDRRPAEGRPPPAVDVGAALAQLRDSLPRPGDRAPLLDQARK